MIFVLQLKMEGYLVVGLFLDLMQSPCAVIYDDKFFWQHLRALVL